MWSLADRLKHLERELGLTAAPSPFDMDPKIIRRRVEATLSAEERERKCYMKHKLRLAAIFTAAALALTGTALAAGPTLLQAALGAFAPYAQTQEGVVEKEGIRVKVLSALTDDLSMKAVTRYAEAQEQSPVVLAIAAGCDMVVTAGFKTQIPQVLTALEDGTLTRERVDEAVSRVLGWKYDLGLIPQEEQTP